MPYKDKKVRREKHAEYMRTVWYPKNKQVHISRVKALKKKLIIFIDDYKRRNVCCDCGYDGNKYPQVLEFDHVGLDKGFEIGSFSHHITSLTTLKKEIEKCELVCANCHRIRTTKRRNDTSV